MKKDGRRVPFDRDKLVGGIIHACQKRPVSREEIDHLVARVESRVFSGAADEIPSRDIGEAVMVELQDLDEIAYVRFASVYRSFRDVNQFMDELRVLLDRPPEREPES